LIVYRITKKKHQGNAFTGEGAALFPGRWNHMHTKLVYTADSLALAQLELLTKLRASDLLKAYVYFEIEIDEQYLLHLDLNDLPDGWYTEPPNHISRDIGKDWMQSNASVGLLVPSVTVPQQQNCLINPGHPEYSKAVKIGNSKKCILDLRTK